jgi:hypothetical protein
MKTEIKPRPSKYLAIFLCTIHLGAICCVLFLNLPIWLIILLTILIGYSFNVTLQRYVLLKSSKAIIKLRKEKDNSWRLLNNKNQILNAHLRSDSFISRYLIILNFNIAKKFSAISVLLCPDSLDKEILRRLRVLLTVRN